MKTQRKAMISFAASAIALSTMTACGPTMDAQKSQAAQNNAAFVRTTEQPPPTPPKIEECRVRASSLGVPSVESITEVEPQYEAFFLAHQDTFRCCFEAVYAPTRARTDGHVVLFVKVDAAGALKSSNIVTEETISTSPELDACMLEVTRALAYPKPANHAELGYKRSFTFKAHR